MKIMSSPFAEPGEIRHGIDVIDRQIAAYIVAMPAGVEDDVVVLAVQVRYFPTWAMVMLRSLISTLGAWDSRAPNARGIAALPGQCIVLS